MFAAGRQGLVHPQAEPEAAPSPAGDERGKPEILAPRVLGDRAVIAAGASSAVGYVALQDTPAVGSGRGLGGRSAVGAPRGRNDDQRRANHRDPRGWPDHAGSHTDERLPGSADLPGEPTGTCPRSWTDLNGSGCPHVGG